MSVGKERGLDCQTFAKVQSFILNLFNNTQQWSLDQATDYIIT